MSHFINDCIGVDTMQVMPEFRQGDFIDTANNVFQVPTFDCPRRVATSNAIVNMTQDASLIGNVTAKYIPHQEKHKNSMLAATKHLSDAKTLNSYENSYEIMESNFKLHDELHKCTVNIENFDHQSRMDIESRHDLDPDAIPHTYFERNEPALGPENAYREGVQIYVINNYFIRVWPHDTGDGIYYKDSELYCEYDIEFDTAFHDDFTWKKNVIERQVNLVNGETNEPFSFNLQNPYESASWDRFFQSILNGKPEKRRYSFGAPAMFRHGLKHVDIYRMEGDEMDLN